MPLQITARHLDITEDQKEYIEKKVQRLRKHFPKIDEISVTVSLEKFNHIVEVNFRAGPIHAFTKRSDANLRTAIDKAVSNIEMQSVKAKKKRFGNKMHAGRTDPIPPEDDEESLAESA